MGVDHMSYVIVGWKVKIKNVIEWLETIKKDKPNDNNICSCYEYRYDHECIYDECYFRTSIPEGWTIIVTSPYYDSSFENYEAAVSINLSSNNLSANLEHFNNPSFINKGKIFALELGARDIDCKIFSLDHIF